LVKLLLPIDLNNKEDTESDDYDCEEEHTFKTLPLTPQE